jgi:5-methylcytosine-specific restriction endonuclease McrA
MSRKKTDEEKKETQRLYRLKNKDRINARIRERYKSEPNFRENRKKRAADYYEQNREKCLNQFKDRRESNPSYKIEYRERNRDKLLIQGVNYRNKNREEINKKARIRQKNNPILIRLNEHVRRARLKNASGLCTVEQWESRLAFYGWKCYYCGSNTNITIDHRIPISRGGSNWPANLVPACLGCNSSKRDKTEKEFKMWLLSYNHHNKQV